ncbi:MAG TPA: phosphotransferase [Streptosporangiaceae bacterium]|nr:phosphotransferase [Streptosporangiaceae bacterium]
MSERPATAGLVHGMGKDLAEPDWSPLTAAEVSAVLARYGPPGAAAGNAAAAITWHSPRPMSAAALVRRGGAVLFVKRHHTSVRTTERLVVEHAFARHLRVRGVPVPVVLRGPGGVTTVERGGFVYEVHGAASGVDLYRDAVSWSPFSSLSHARTAGATLARLHQAAADFPVAAQSPGVLTTCCDVITAADPLAAVSLILAQRPGLARYLSERHWQQDIARHHLPAIGRAAPLLKALPRQWGHGDWHPSNLTWTSTTADAAVAAVLDFGLANRTFAVHDLATALERSTVGWLDLPGSGRADADYDAIDALLDGYETVRPLQPAEAAVLPEVLPVVHLEYALSEIEYFADVVRSRGNADLAYGTYLLDHARWFAGPEGSAVLEHLRRRAR